MAVNGLSWKVALVLFVFSLSVNAKTIYDLRTNYEVAPLSVEGTPVFSWKMDASGQYKAAQTAYRIIVATSESKSFFSIFSRYSLVTCGRPGSILSAAYKIFASGQR